MELDIFTMSSSSSGQVSCRALWTCAGISWFTFAFAEFIPGYFLCLFFECKTSFSYGLERFWLTPTHGTILEAWFLEVYSFTTHNVGQMVSFLLFLRPVGKVLLSLFHGRNISFWISALFKDVTSTAYHLPAWGLIPWLLKSVFSASSCFQCPCEQFAFISCLTLWA